MSKLSEFVAEQIRNGTSSSEIRLHLMQNGWSESDVNLAFDEARGGKTKKTAFIAVIGIIIIGILAFSLISLANKTTPTPTPPIPLPTNSTLPEISLEPELPSIEGCMEKESSFEKDECYKQLLKNNFDCRTLVNKVEITYCNRAYEDLMLKGVEKIDEN